MPASKRRIDSGVAQQLLTQPYRFGFFQAMRVLEHLFAGQGVCTADIVSQRLRFRNTLRMGFPASEIERLVGYTRDDVEFAIDTHGRGTDWVQLAEVDITPAFMGMLGGQGVLPFAYTELIGEREIYHRDHAARAFLDIFFNRAMALYYAAWKKYRLAIQYELERRERFLPLVLSVAGLHSVSSESGLYRDKGRIHAQSLAFYAATIMQRPVSAAFMQTMLCEYFATAIRIQQFAGAWYAIPTEQQSRLGGNTALLGVNMVAGERVWQRDLRLQLWIGPLREARYHDFLPGGNAASALAKWLTLLGGDVLEYEVCLILHRDDVRASVLQPTGGSRLGWDTYAASRSADSHRSDARYLVQTMH